jgi:hypothetical protein
LVKAAKDKVGQSYAHAGTGFSSHVAGEIIKKHALLDLKSTAYTAAPELFKAIGDGRVLFGITEVSAPPSLTSKRVSSEQLRSPDLSVRPCFPKLSRSAKRALADTMQVRGSRCWRQRERPSQSLRS